MKLICKLLLGSTLVFSACHDDTVLLPYEKERYFCDAFSGTTFIGESLALEFGWGDSCHVLRIGQIINNRYCIYATDEQETSILSYKDNVFVLDSSRIGDSLMVVTDKLFIPDSNRHGHCLSSLETDPRQHIPFTGERVFYARVRDTVHMVMTGYIVFDGFIEHPPWQTVRYWSVNLSFREGSSSGGLIMHHIEAMAIKTFPYASPVLDIITSTTPLFPEDRIYTFCKYDYQNFSIQEVRGKGTRTVLTTRF